MPTPQHDQKTDKLSQIPPTEDLMETNAQREMISSTKTTNKLHRPDKLPQINTLTDNLSLGISTIKPLEDKAPGARWYRVQALRLSVWSALEEE
ncbi:hypothetical protein KIN20_012956 [Parelaphostrongylus tenuis]|uniref:Uncharacterized protein n=1 Tax=Parelaphostrongylus tenuis TaxID=148309 RepID=A0AAD5MBF7_PARTN|nr:hypothetical protein KIN20_012956 [Parelaphostrongylus tenuis]